MADHSDLPRFEGLGEALAGCIDELTAGVLEAQASLLPAWLQEPPLWGRIEAATRAMLATEITYLREGATLPETCPDVDAAVARQSAESGASVAIVLGGYRSAHRVLWEAWTGLVANLGLEADDPGEAEALRSAGSDFFFAYGERVSGLAAEEFQRARPAGTEQVRLTVVRALLEGEDEVDTAPLDYPVARNHVGLVGCGTGLVEALPAIASRFDCRLLLLNVYEDPWWAWLGRSRPLAEDRGELLAALAAGASVGDRVGVGGEHPGPAGMRLSNAQAAAAFGATTLERALVGYDDIALEDLAARDREAALQFASAELGPLGRGRRAERLRETIAAYFACGQNARACAKRLGVHHQTVAQRLAAAEALLGRPPADRRAELEVALRLERFLADGP